MNIDNYTDTISNCRFCFMCRHLSGVGNVMFTESDTPRIRAAMIYGVTMHPEQLANRDFIDTLYRSDLSAACRYHCVSHYDENGLNIAARTDIVNAGFAPDYIRKLADELRKSEKWSRRGSGDVLYFKDPCTAEAISVPRAFDKIMKKAGIPYRTISGGCIGKALKILGFAAEAREAAEKFARIVNDTGAKLLVVSTPAAYDALVNDYREFGIKISARVMHVSEYLQSLKLKFRKAGELYYLESDFLKNYNHNYKFPHALLASLGAKIIPFGTNNEESYTCGEGAVVLPQINESIVRKLAEYVAERADDPRNDLIVVASPYTKIQLSKYTQLNVQTLEELAASCL